MGEGSSTVGLQLLHVSASILLTPFTMQVALPLDPGVVLLDIAFTGSNPDHGRRLSLSA